MFAPDLGLSSLDDNLTASSTLWDAPISGGLAVSALSNPAVMLLLALACYLAVGACLAARSISRMRPADPRESYPDEEAVEFVRQTLGWGYLVIARRFDEVETHNANLARSRGLHAAEQAIAALPLDAEADEIHAALAAARRRGDPFAAVGQARFSKDFEAGFLKGSQAGARVGSQRVIASDPPGSAPVVVGERGSARLDAGVSR